MYRLHSWQKCVCHSFWTAKKHFVMKCNDMDIRMNNYCNNSSKYLINLWYFGSINWTEWLDWSIFTIVLERILMANAYEYNLFIYSIKGIYFHVTEISQQHVVTAIECFSIYRYQNCCGMSARWFCRLATAEISNILRSALLNSLSACIWISKAACRTQWNVDEDVPPRPQRIPPTELAPPPSSPLPSTAKKKHTKKNLQQIHRCWTLIFEIVEWNRQAYNG